MAEKKTDHGRARRPGGRKGRTAPLYAAVDIGTNNCRLLVAQRQGNSFRVVDSHSQIARLGEGLHETGRLSDAAMDRALDAMTQIARKLEAKSVKHVRCIATEACRKAENGPEFVKRVRDKTGLNLTIIPAKEEAKLALIGCQDLIAPDAKFVLVVDTGGGSTELSWVNAKVAREAGLHGIMRRAPIQGWVSLPLGVVTLSEAFEHLGEEAAYPAMLNHAREVLSTWKQCTEAGRALTRNASHLIGTSGTVTCLAGVHMNLTRYRRDAIDGTWLNKAEGLSVIQRLRDIGMAGRCELPTIGEERAGLMLSGCAIVEAIWDVFPTDRMRIADRGLREGLLLSMMHGGASPKKRRRRRKPAASSSPPTETPKEGAPSHE